MDTNDKNVEIDDFNNIFGTFQRASNKGKPLSKIIKVDSSHAQPCRCCGELPEIHIANFDEPANHPHNVYICCSHCSWCDGEWYPNMDAALYEWNAKNAGSAPKDPTVKDLDDFVDYMMDDFRISD